ncbi:hypothetical protein ACKUCH_01315 [Flavobacterium psychrophilum]
MDYKLSHYTVIADLEDNDNNIVHSTKTGTSLILKKNVINAINNKNFSQVDEVLLEKIINSEIIVPNSLNEIEQIIEEFNISKL